MSKIKTTRNVSNFSYVQLKLIQLLKQNNSSVKISRLIKIVNFNEELYHKVYIRHEVDILKELGFVDVEIVYTYAYIKKTDNFDKLLNEYGLIEINEYNDEINL